MMHGGQKYLVFVVCTTDCMESCDRGGGWTRWRVWFFRKSCNVMTVSSRIVHTSEDESRPLTGFTANFVKRQIVGLTSHKSFMIGRRYMYKRAHVEIHHKRGRLQHVSDQFNSLLFPSRVEENEKKTKKKSQEWENCEKRFSKLWAQLADKSSSAQALAIWKLRINYRVPVQRILYRSA